MNEEEFYTERLLKNDNYKIFLPETPHIKRAPVSGEGFNNTSLHITLKEDYPEIYESIQEEAFFISEDEKYFYLYEIYDKENDKIIGFASFTVLDEKSIALNQIYVFPDYRGQRHFVKVYNFFSILLPDAEIFVRNPNHCIIKNIKDLNYCSIIKERFLVSNINFISDQIAYDDALNYTNKEYEESGQKALYNTISNLYDLKLDAVLKVSSNNKIFTGNEDLLKIERSTISMVRQEDENKYDILKKRREDSWIQKGNYFKKISKLFKNNAMKVNRQ